MIPCVPQFDRVRHHGLKLHPSVPMPPICECSWPGVAHSVLLVGFNAIKAWNKRAVGCK